MKNLSLVLFVILLSTVAVFAKSKQRTPGVSSNEVHKVFVEAGNHPGCLDMPGYWYQREARLAHLFVASLGWQEASKPTDPGTDRILELCAVGGGSVANPNPPTTVTYNCQSSSTSTDCHGSDGSYVGASANSVVITPGRDQSIIAYGPGILVSLKGQEVSQAPLSRRTYELTPVIPAPSGLISRGVFLPPTTPFLESVDGTEPPALWAVMFCEELQGKKAGCGKRVQALWKQSK